MTILTSLRSGLNSIFKMVATILDNNITPAEFRNSVLGYETKDMNDFARKNNLPIYVTIDKPKTGETNAVFLTIHVRQGNNAYPAERKIAKSIDMTSDEAVQDGLKDAKMLFLLECKRINPNAVPVQSAELK